MARQHRERAGRDAGRERSEVALADLGGGSLDGRHRDVRVANRGAVAGEMLQRRHDTRRLEPRRHRRREATHDSRVRAERPRPEWRGRGEREHVTHRREHERRAHRRRLEPDGDTGLAGKLLGARRAQR